MPITLTSQDYTQGISNEISCWGDSLTQGAGSTGITGGLTYPQHLNNILYPRLIQNFGLGGQGMDAIASRQGAKPIYITLASNALGGGNDRSITSMSSQFLSNSDTNAYYVSGIVNNVPCIITRTVVSSVETYVIRGAQNSSASIPANSIFYPDSAYNALPTIQVWWWGRNNVPTLTGLDTLIDNAISIMPSPRRFLVIGVLPALNEIIGTVNYIAITAMNATLAANYPNNYIASTPPTTAEMNAIMYTPTTQDNIDIANGVFPTGMRNDNIHLNGYGYNIIANRVAKLINQYGW
jgi:lysophospholipase L1-like esterase